MNKKKTQKQKKKQHFKQLKLDILFLILNYKLALFRFSETFTLLSNL